MKHLTLTLEFPSGGVMVGGVSPSPDGSHRAHASRADGQPFVPATAIRGALRQNLEALLRGAGERVCTAGNGVEYGSSGPSGPCTVNAGQRCIPCRLFGGQHDAVPFGEVNFSALELSDADCLRHPGADSASTGTLSAAWQTRPGVGISRRTRSVEHQRLFMQRVPSRRNLTLVATGRLKDDSLAKYLQVVVANTHHIGSGRSRGLSRVNLALTLTDMSPDAGMAMPPGDEVMVRLTLRSSAALAAAVSERNLLQSRLDVPGATLRGAVGFSLAEQLTALGADPNADQPFQDLVAEAGAHFGFLHPIDAPTHDPAGPLPITALTCKVGGRGHVLADQLLDSIAVQLIERPAQTKLLQQRKLESCTCGQPLRGAYGWRTHGSMPAVRSLTRVSLDRRRDAAADEQLFCRELVLAGTTFEGTIRNIPPDSRDRLALALGSLRGIGRGRVHGWGQVSVQVAEAPAWGILLDRARSFRSALRSHLSKLRLEEVNADHLIPITLLSPMIPEAGGDGGQAIADALGGTIFLSQRRFEREGGWDQKQGRMTPALAVAAGAVFVVQVKEKVTDEAVLKRLATLEKTGIGDRRHQGFGHVVGFDPFFLKRELKPEPGRKSGPALKPGEKTDLRLEIKSERSQPAHGGGNSVKHQEQEATPSDLEQNDPEMQLRPYRKALVEHAERVMDKAFAQGRLNLNKSQLNHLVSICGQAEVDAEIKNYLRYQVGRGERTTGWSLELVNGIIDAADEAMKGIQDDAVRVYAWRLFTTYLTRAFTYQKAATDPRNSSNHQDHGAGNRTGQRDQGRNDQGRNERGGRS